MYNIFQAPVEDDMLASFFTEISTKPDPATLTRPAADAGAGTGTGAGADTETDKKAENILTEKYVSQDLGDGRAQVERLTGPHFEWKNLNPYQVFQVGYSLSWMCVWTYLIRLRMCDRRWGCSI